MKHPDNIDVISPSDFPEEQEPVSPFVEIQQFIDDSKREYDENKTLSLKTRERAKNVAREYIEKLTTEQDNKKAEEIARLLAQLYSHPGFVDDELFLSGQMRTLCLKMDWNEWGTDRFIYSGDEEKDVITKRTNLLFRSIFTHYGLNPVETAAAWRDGIFPMEKKGDRNLSQNKQRELIFRNLEALRALEFNRPGAAALLAKEFGVLSFGRYSLELLIKQHDERNDLEHPYGTVITARRDYNGAFYQKSDVYRNLSNQLSGQYRLRFIETGGRFGIARSLIRLDRRYGKSQKISFAFVNGHGDPNHLALGDWSEESPAAQITTSDIEQGRGLERIKDFFAEHATIILDSCSTGKKGGLGQRMFKRLGVRVIAFDKASYGISSLGTSSTKDGGIDFSIKFLRRNLFGMKDRKARVYK